MSQPPNTQDRRGGFTLVELMVAMSLLAVIMVALMMAFQQAQRAFRLGANQVDVLENSRALSGLFSRQLQEMTASEVPGNLNLFAQGVSSFGMQLPSGITQDLQLQRLFFLTRARDTATAYEYVLVRQDSNSPVASLYCRTLTNHWDGVQSITDSNSVIGFANTGEFHRVIDGLVHLIVYPLDTNGAPYFTNLIERAVFPSTAGPYPDCIFGNTNLPAFVELEIGILDPQTLKQYDTRFSVNPPMARVWLQEKSAKVYLFRQRIPIRGKGRLDT